MRGGKGGKDRTVYLPDGAIPVVEDWLNIPSNTPGPLLCPAHKSGRVMVRRLTAQAVLFLVQKRAQEIGSESFSPHDFRRTFMESINSYRD